MQTSITWRLILLVNLLVILTAVAVALLAGHVSANVVQRRLVRDTARQTARFLESRRLPLSRRLMQDFHQIFGTHFAVGPAGKPGISKTSFPSNATSELAHQLQDAKETRSVEVGETTYRIGSHVVVPGRGAGQDQRARLYVFMPTEEVARAGRTAWRQALLGAVPAVLLATLLSLGLSLTITCPLRRLAGQIDQIVTSRDDQDARDMNDELPAALPGKSGPREIKQLRNSFNHLLNRLSHARQELIRSERMVTLGKVAASAVHELKNPLSAIQMHLRLLQEESLPESAREDMRMLIREVDRMDLYLQELSELSHDGSHGEATCFVPPDSITTVNLRETVESVHHLIESRCQHAGINIDFDFHTDTPLGRAAQDQLRQVLMNLLINAVEAMPGGGTIAIATELRPNNHVRLTVKDTGSGIEPDPPEKVFDLFCSTKEHGSGLGLYISRQLMLAQNGEIGCTNCEEGAQFWIELETPANNQIPDEGYHVP